MKKTTTALMTLLIILSLLLCSCASGLPYRVWESWDEMKETLGDHYLYPTYLPEFIDEQSVHLESWYNFYPINPDGSYIPYNPTQDNEAMFYGYWAMCWVDSTDPYSLRFNACDYEIKRDKTSISFINSPNIVGNYDEILYETTELISNIAVEIVTKYAGSRESSVGYIVPNKRTVFIDFEFNSIVYSAIITQRDVTNKYADDEHRDELLKIAKSIIKQGDE